MHTTVLAIGESLVDVVVEAGGRTAEHPGGSPMNIAFGCARLGVPVTLLTAIGSDDRGRSIAAHLESAGVDVDAGSFRDEATSTATAHLQPDGSARYTFDLRWSLPAAIELPAAALVHVGSLGVFVEPGGSEVVERLRALGSDTLVTFDPNIRPSITTDHGAALARFDEVAAVTTLLKLSDEDAAWLYPGASIDEAIDRILQLGPAVVVVTQGGDGAVLATKTDRVSVPGRTVTVVDTIGAGDSFMSALIAQLARMLESGASDAPAFDRDVLTAFGTYAAGCAAITVSRAGADPPTRAEAETPQLSDTEAVEAPGRAGIEPS